VGAFLDRPLKQGVTPVNVQEFILFQSRLTSGGAVHTPVQAFVLSLQ
jgi:hypothetical protein